MELVATKAAFRKLEEITNGSIVVVDKGSSRAWAIVCG